MDHFASTFMLSAITNKNPINLWPIAHDFPWGPPSSKLNWTSRLFPLSQKIVIVFSVQVCCNKRSLRRVLRTGLS